jgi:hypothetical protein
MFKSYLKNSIFLTAFYYILILPLNAANDNYTLGSRSAGLANATVMLPDLWSVHHNQAGLAFIDKITLGFHHENKFIVPEFSLQAFAAAIPAKPGTIGFSYSYFGYHSYHETKVGLSFGRTLGKFFAAGVQLDYLHTFIAEEYGNQGNLAIETGILAIPLENLFIGAHIFNPTRTKISAYNEERVPTILRAGIGYKFAGRIFICMETEKELDSRPIYKSGIEFMFFDKLFVRTGISTNPTQNTFGIGYSYKGFKANVAFTLHQQLGLTPHFSLMFSFK